MHMNLHFLKIVRCFLLQCGSKCVLCHYRALGDDVYPLSNVLLLLVNI